MAMYGRNQHKIVIILRLKIHELRKKKKKPKLKKKKKKSLPGAMAALPDGRDLR